MYWLQEGIQQPGFPLSQKACNLFKHAMWEWLNNIPDYGAGPSITNKEMATESTSCPVDLHEMFLDQVQVLFWSLKNFKQKLNQGFQEQVPEKDLTPPPEYQW